MKENLGDKIKALTFALPMKKGGQNKTEKIFESLEIIARISNDSNR